MPNNKSNSETSSIESQCRACLTRTFTDPDLYARLKEQERISKKNNFHRSYSLSFSSIFSIHTFNSLDDEVFLGASTSKLSHQAKEKVLPGTPSPAPNSSCTKIFYFSSSSSSEFDSDEDIGATHFRRNTL